jgi:hypothetical protein
MAEKDGFWGTYGRAFAQAGALTLGAAALAALVHHAGSAGLVPVLQRAARWLPLALVIEGMRIATEVAATRSLAGRGASAIPRSELLRAHLVGYAVTLLMPAGRAAAEALKASMLSPYIGGARAAAIATKNQSLSLLATAAVSVPCAIATFAVAGFSPVPVAIALHTVALVVAGVSLQLVARHAGLLAWLARRLPRVAEAARAYQDAVRDQRAVPAFALAAFVANRALQVVGLGLLIAAVGGPLGPLEALVGQGVEFVGATVGDLVPAQLGATDGAFALAASVLRISVADAVALSLLVHAVQLAWAALGALGALAWPSRITAREALPVRR